MDSYDFASDFYSTSKGSYSFSMDSNDFASDLHLHFKGFLCIVWIPMISHPISITFQKAPMHFLWIPMISHPLSITFQRVPIHFRWIPMISHPISIQFQRVPVHVQWIPMISHPISITFQRDPMHLSMAPYDFASDFYLISKGSYAFVYGLLWFRIRFLSHFKGFPLILWIPMISHPISI